MSGYPSESALLFAVERARRNWQTRQQAGAGQTRPESPAPRPFSIALSREAGTQGSAVAKEVGRLLGWQVYDRELLEKIAHDMDLRTSLLQSVDERQQSWMLEVAEAFLSAPEKGDWGLLVDESGFVQHLIKTVLALGVHGECVIVGRGAAFILPPETTLRVRLVGPIPERIAAWSRQYGISEKAAAQQVRTLDRQRTDFVQDHFRKDSTDPRNYDLVLNTPRLSVARSAEVIVDTLHRLEAQQRKKPTGKPSA
jgi:cytidylate kinase